MAALSSTRASSFAHSRACSSVQPARALRRAAAVPLSVLSSSGSSRRKFVTAKLSALVGSFEPSAEVSSVYTPALRLRYPNAGSYVDWALPTVYLEPLVSRPHSRVAPSVCSLVSTFA